MMLFDLVTKTDESTTSGPRKAINAEPPRATPQLISALLFVNLYRYNN